MTKECKWVLKEPADQAKVSQLSTELGIDRVLMCCDKENVASAKSILRNGGVLENEVPEDGGINQRYWIRL